MANKGCADSRPVATPLMEYFKATDNRPEPRHDFRSTLEEAGYLATQAIPAFPYASGALATVGLPSIFYILLSI